jgi:hypothetical protein
MNFKEVVKKICVALNIEVKLEQAKLQDGVTIVEADSFESGESIVVVTQDDQRIALPIGEYVMENGMTIVVAEEGVISEIKEMEEPEQETEIEVEAENKPENDMAKIKKTVESMVKETFFAEIESKDKEIERLKAELAQMQEPKPIVHNPENAVETEQKAPRTTRDLVLKFINS